MWVSEQLLTNLTIGQKQRKFARMVADLIIFAYGAGYELTFGDAWSQPHYRTADGKPVHKANSLHHERLAVDLNLFKGGQYLARTEDHRELGEYWESIGGSWGGRFNDGNHYSLEHGGRK